MNKKENESKDIYKYHESVVNEVLNSDPLYDFFRKLYWEYSVPSYEYKESLKNKLEELKEKFEKFDTINLFKLRKLLSAYGIVIDDNLDYAYGNKHLDYIEITDYNSKNEPVYQTVRNFALSITFREESPIEFPSVPYGIGNINDGNIESYFLNAFVHNDKILKKADTELEKTNELISLVESELEKLDENNEETADKRQELLKKIELLETQRNSIKVKYSYESRIKAINFFNNYKVIDPETKELFNKAIQDLRVKVKIREEIESLEDQIKNTDMNREFVVESYERLISEKKVNEFELELVFLLIKRVEELLQNGEYNFDTGKSIELRKMKDGALFVNFAEIYKIVKCFIAEIYEPEVHKSTREMAYKKTIYEADLK